MDKIKKIKEGRRVVALHFIIEGKTKHELAVMRGEEPKVQMELQLNEQVTDIDNIVEENQTDILFEKYEAVIIKKFGVTPSVFLKMLDSGKYSESAIDQAINVTRRAKYNQEIKKSTAGFFLKALKEGYTDEKEEARKTKLDKANKVKQLEEKLILLKTEFSQKVNERIRDLTTENPDLTEQAIKEIINNPLMKALIVTKETAIGRSLTVDDYRQDEHLQMLVINNIVQMQQKQFEDITSQFNEPIRKLEEELKRLK